jgi:hypothetical protein
MSDDYIEAGKRRFAVLEAARAAAVADIQAHRVNHDEEAMAEAIQTVANLDADLANLNNLYSRYIQSTQAPPEPDEATLQAMPVQNMSHNQWFNYLNKTTKHGLDVDAYRRGVAEVAARRARGE